MAGDIDAATEVELLQGIPPAALYRPDGTRVDVHVLYVWGVFGVAQLVEGWFLTPVVVGDKVGLHPLVVMVALLAGANLLGIWGMLFAIPVAATLSVLLTAWLAHYRKSSFYLG